MGIHAFRRAPKTPKNSHWRETIHVSRMQQEIHAKRSFIQTHQNASKGSCKQDKCGHLIHHVDLDSIILNSAGEADQSALGQTGTSSGGMPIGMEDDYDDSDDESGSDISDSEISAAGVSGTT